MQPNLPTVSHTISLLTRTPAALDALLRDLPETWTSRNEGENTWSPADIVAHLNYCERVDWMRRASIIREAGEPRELTPFDRGGHQQETQPPLPQLLDEFARLREESLSELRSWKLQPEDLARQGRHPAFGLVTLSQLLATWATHDLSHLHQISRVMAHQYREAVGPWHEYLGVLQCGGHSAP